MAMNSANDLELLSLVAKMPRASLEAVVLDMVATGHPINEGELEVAATEDEACLGACAVAPGFYISVLAMLAVGGIRALPRAPPTASEPATRYTDATPSSVVL